MVGVAALRQAAPGVTAVGDTAQELTDRRAELLGLLAGARSGEASAGFEAFLGAWELPLRDLAGDLRELAHLLVRAADGYQQADGVLPR